MTAKVLCALLLFINFSTSIYANNKETMIKLKPAHFKEENFKILLEKRYSCRLFKEEILNLDDISSILWATCGKKYDSITGATRTIPSAGATYALELYIVVGRNSVDKLKEGVYHYLIDEHSLEIIIEGDLRKELSAACLSQDFIAQAPVSLVIAAVPKRTTFRYGTRGERYVHMEAGHASQNAYLAATNLDLGTVEVGAFSDDSVKRLLRLDRETIPLIVMPTGFPSE
jgi:SagB-type dehydrogenase family enzyme